MERDAFVIMPFSPTSSCADWTEVYEHVFRPSLAELGWSCERAVPETGSLIASIIDKLSTATVVLADITDRNANVFYELGVRHSLSLRTIIVSQDTQHVPSDLKGYWHVVYGLAPAKVTKFKDDLRRILAKIEENPEKRDNPVADYLASRNQSVFASENKQNIKKLNALITEVKGNVIEIESFLKSSDWEDGRYVPLLNQTAISLLLDTYYVDLGSDTFILAYEFRRRTNTLALGATGDGIGQQALDIAKSLTERLEAARDQIQRGVFLEPPTPSYMEWQSGRSRTRTIINCTYCDMAFSARALEKTDGLICPKCGGHHGLSSDQLISAIRDLPSTACQIAPTSQDDSSISDPKKQ